MKKPFDTNMHLIFAIVLAYKVSTLQNGRTDKKRTFGVDEGDLNSEVLPEKLKIPTVAKKSFRLND